MEIYAKNCSLGYQKDKVLIKDLNFSAKNGQMIAIMGKSGVGKTSIMKLFFGDIRHLGGEFGIKDDNGNYIKKPYIKKKLISHVTQDDIFIKEFSVKQNLIYYAKLHGSYNEKKLFDTLDTLGLSQSVADSKIYANNEYKISGGQRKRANIAMELMRDSSIFFVDEPTSGLSTQDGQDVLGHLKKIAKEKNKIIFVIIHQPSFDMINFFDKILLIEKSETNTLPSSSKFQSVEHILNQDTELKNIDPKQYANYNNLIQKI